MAFNLMLQAECDLLRDADAQVFGHVKDKKPVSWKTCYFISKVVDTTPISPLKISINLYDDHKIFTAIVRMGITSETSLNAIS